MADAAVSAPRSFRLTVRARLALTYAGLLTIAGVVLLAIIAFFVGLVPTYDFVDATALDSTGYGIAEPGVPAGEVMPSEGWIATDEGLAAAATTVPVTVASRSDMLQLLLWVSGGALLVLAAGGTWAGWFVAGRMLRPLQEVNRAAHRAARGHLDHRIALAGPRDEITDLADTFDQMLTELERSLGAHRRFAANASHELRTPLATTRTMLDVAISSPRSSREPGLPDIALLERLRETNERSIATVEALLDLSEAEAGAAATVPVELAELAASIVDDARPEAALADVRIELATSPETISGDEVLLRQMLANLVQNAIRHNVPGGVVRVSTRSSSRWTTIEVANSGDVLESATVAELTAPFYRVRGRTTAASQRGRGLGLSIVEAIAARHGATLHLAPRVNGGLRVAVRFPR
ncbi:sensor histidine kinase [Agromyces subbeticus]|uniref:sensor histidine kinase n=1 Tax=Agromyces subbeticus TaxID=293890 RepID=UPI0003B3849A|nr:HAMP domain-containing sensor histidine kinase [Agromyces subbeticus]